jgi:hypothetical protein
MLFKNKLLANEYSKGLRKQSGALSLRIKKSITAKQTDVLIGNG